ncbi:hypothetical protein PLICRDRAFT_32909 [Plicaturopsis crispa FD-325 SS-3]|uniref:Uncharacterized protein n=1 Tax=Plicaturopsis crispa FD-325 SS-3 TaxID=944288 RepID=A0A0C9T2G9_PLICR|nr:hypothetical protein PLICRDRAFT_32909 [Plicaturopsis crispa FD-325 SS-3]
MDADAPSALKRWKHERISGLEITLSKAARSVESERPLVTLQRVKGAERFTVNRINNKEPAVFKHAAVWLRGTPPETGNYVPPRATASRSIPTATIQRAPSWSCKVTYTFDTSKDKSLYEDILVTRSNWQCRVGNQFQMACPLFSRKTKRNANLVEQNKFPYTPHPVIRQAVEGSSEYVPSFVPPARLMAVKWEGSTKSLVLLKSTAQPELLEGDIVWISFTISYVIGQDEWFPEICPREITRVFSPPPDSEGLDMRLDGARPPLHPEGVLNTIPYQYPLLPLGIAENEDEDEDDKLYWNHVSPPPDDVELGNEQAGNGASSASTSKKTLDHDIDAPAAGSEMTMDCEDRSREPAAGESHDTNVLATTTGPSNKPSDSSSSEPDPATDAKGNPEATTKDVEMSDANKENLHPQIADVAAGKRRATDDVDDAVHAPSPPKRKTRAAKEKKSKH